MKRFLILSVTLFLANGLRAGEEVKASHILLESLDKADLVRNEIVENGGNREAFMYAARKYSKDVNTKHAGGALGWFTRQKMVREFSQAAFDMKPGEISAPVKSQYGYHLIFLEDRKDTTPPPVTRPPVEATKVAPVAPTTPTTPTPTTPTTPTTPVTPATPGTPATTTTPAAATVPPATPAAPVVPEKPKLQPKALKLAIDIKEKSVIPTRTVEVELILTNMGQEPQKVFAVDLLPLGFAVTGEVAPISPPATWTEMKKPDAPIVTLNSRMSIGGIFTLNDYFKDLPANGRYRLAWRPQLFIGNLETTFKDLASLPDYDAAKATVQDARTFRREAVGQPPRVMYRNYEQEITFSVFEPLSAAKKYYASIELDRQSQPIWVELFSDKQLQPVQQFSKLALTGFYDWTALFDVQKGNYIRGGSPTDNDFGGPEQFLTVPNPNPRKVTHAKGTISMITRTNRSAREIGSMFFFCRKDHPEWDADHAPIGKIISGEEVLDKIEAITATAPNIRTMVKKINVVTADKLPPDLAQVAATVTPATPATTPSARALPVVNVKTAKGQFTVELFEDDAPRSVNNFIDLVEKKFFDPDPATKKEMTFYSVVPQIAVITGSPTNGPDGGPGYRITSETTESKRTHTKGTLTMLLETDPATNHPVPDTAGSQFMICLQDMPAWNGLYTPFGKVTEGMDVVEKLAEGDKIESVTIVSKRNHPYKAFQLPIGSTPGGR